jgi:hypothetical protein
MKPHHLPLILTAAIATLAPSVSAADNFVSFQPAAGATALTLGADVPLVIAADTADRSGVAIALQSFLGDVTDVTGRTPQLSQVGSGKAALPAGTRLVVGTIAGNAYLRQLVRKKIIDGRQLEGKTEKYLLTTVKGAPGADGDVVVIAGSDMRGAIYGIYELSRQMGISPWHWWADVPAVHHDSLYILPGTFTDGEPTVRYRGIFLNDEAPCLSGWVREAFPDSSCPSARSTARGFNHLFYARVFELLLRLKANYLWPAMWGNAFYADDPLNSTTAAAMGIMLGTSHHEPMARNHQEWARQRSRLGQWDYAVNQAVIDTFFRNGMERVKDNEDLITIGMRGDGDTPMGGREGEDDKYVSQDEYNLRLLQRIINNQRQIIADVTGRPAARRQQIWALYKEVQRLYDLGLQVPDDVLILLCDDNWGNIRRVPAADRRKRQGGWGMYYHVDYVGAPRSTKWANVTPIAHLWEQMNLAYDYGIDRLWILNVGDLKPMEYPTQFFLDMAWRPEAFTADEVLRHTRRFCASCFGEEQADEAARILDAYTRFNGRVTPEMLSAKTYNVASGEWASVVNDYKALEADALRQFLSLPAAYQDAYFQLVLYPVQTMANLYEMYYAVAMNRRLYALGDLEANRWADLAERCFKRDAELSRSYNHDLADGKWNHLMDEVHIGYTSWNTPKTNVMPEVQRLDSSALRQGGYTFASTAGRGYIAIEADRYYTATPPTTGSARWTFVPGIGRTRGGMVLLPHDAEVQGAALTYKCQLPAGVDTVRVHLITNSTLPFSRAEGHRYALALSGADAGQEVVINYNGRYNEDNQWEMYDVVATRVIETVTPLAVGKPAPGGWYTLSVKPLDPGLVVEKVVVDLGGYEPQHLFGIESPYGRE